MLCGVERINRWNKIVFLEYYGLREQPFGVTPDPRFLYLGLKHREALASLLYGTQTNRGFQALIAKPGMGKTSLIVQYLQRYSKTARTCHLFQTDCNSRELLRQVLSQLGIYARAQDLPGMRNALHQVLLEEMRAGRRFLLVIDEAQNLDENVLESVRLLSNFETPTTKLIQIVLVGQPQLAERLAKPELGQLRQRISIVVRLDPLTLEETAAYIGHRLRVAQYNGPPLFTTRAQLLIAEHSEGIPRNINNLCFNSMSIACALGHKQIDSDIIREVISDLKIESLIPERVPGTRFTSSSSRVISPHGSIRSAPNTAQPRRLSRLYRAIPLIIPITAAMLLMASGISRNPGVHSVPLKTELSPEITFRPSATLRPASEMTTSPATRDLADASGRGSEPPQERAWSSGDVQARIVSIVVEKGTTLRQLSLKYLGRYDHATMLEICKLNPAITDPARIAAGQRLRLPLDLRRK